MKTILIAAAALGLIAASASAQTTKQSRECRYVNGVQRCTMTTDYGDYTSKQTCDYPNGSISNSTCKIDRIPSASARDTVRYDAANEARKARVRAESGYRDPPGSTTR